jgi:uridylate kinase
VNVIRDAISSGVGATTSASGASRRDLQPDFTAELALADQPGALADRINAKLMFGAMPVDLKAEIQGAIEKIVIPASTANNAAQIATAKRNRVNAAIFLAMVSPEFLVQK